MIKKNVLIYANFFWHEIFNIQNTFFKNLKKEFSKKKIKIISNYLFGNTKISKKNTYSVGFVGKYKKIDITKKKGHIDIIRHINNWIYRYFKKYFKDNFSKRVFRL